MAPKTSTEAIVRTFKKLIGRSRPTPELVSQEFETADLLARSASHQSTCFCCIHGLVNWKPKLYKFPSTHVFSIAADQPLYRLMLALDNTGKLILWRDWHVVTLRDRRRDPIEGSDLCAVMLTIFAISRNSSTPSVNSPSANLNSSSIPPKVGMPEALLAREHEASQRDSSDAQHGFSRPDVSGSGRAARPRLLPW